MRKVIFIFLAIFIGGLLPYFHHYTFLIRPSLMTMLFFSFLGIKLQSALFSKNHFFLLLANIVLPIFLFLFVNQFAPSLSYIAFILAVIPTGVAAPIWAEIMNKDIGVVTISVMITTPIMAILIPFYLLYFLGISGKISFLELVLPVVSLIFIPLILSQFIRAVLPKIQKQLLKVSFITFPLFLMNIFIACANASNFIQSSNNFTLEKLIEILFFVFVLCVIQFLIGIRIGRNDYPIESGLGLGRKNTMFGIWLALTFFEPIVVLGPVFYIISQNIFNSFQIWRLEKN